MAAMLPEKLSFILLLLTAFTSVPQVGPVAVGILLARYSGIAPDIEAGWKTEIGRSIAGRRSKFNLAVD